MANSKLDYWSFHVVVLQRTAKKCTKSYNAHAQPLFCSLNLLFSDVPVAVAVVIFLNSLIRAVTGGTGVNGRRQSMVAINLILHS